MKKTNGIILAVTALCFSVSAFAPVSVMAAPEDPYDFPTSASLAPKKHKTIKHHKKHGKKSKRKKSVSRSTARAHVRAAQGYLARLGYDPGPDDGLLGSKTKSALRRFQRDHKLPVTGTLTDAAFRALTKETVSKAETGSLAVAPHPDFLATHPDFYGYYGTQGLNPNVLASPQIIPTRYATVQIAQQQTGGGYSYVVTVNNQPVMQADNQPSYVNVSRTFNLEDADAVLFTSYAAGSKICLYQHRLLVMRSSGAAIRDVANCNRDYEAYTENGMLIISFRNIQGGDFSAGDAWRYDHGTLEKL